MSLLIGIDPGASTGIAILGGGKLVQLQTIEPFEIAELLTTIKPSRVIFEDSRLTSFMFNQAKSRPAALKMARNVGEIDAWCKLIVSICAQLGIQAHGISPKAKGAKLDAKEFARVTGWLAKSNQHERDGAMVAWAYRGAV
jgi:hypothetical protein